MSWNKILLFVALIFLNLPAFANEHGEEKPAPAAGGEHGGAAGPVAEPKYSGRQTDEWLKVQNELTTLKGKVETQKAMVEGLVMAKAHSGGRATSEESETLKKEHENLLKMTEEYNALTTRFQNRFPEKGAAANRIYKRIDVESVETIETNLTAEGRMRKLDKKIKEQYQKTSGEKKVAPAHSPVAHDAASEPGHEAPGEAAAHGQKVHIIESTKNKKKITDEIPVTDQIILQK